MECKFKEQEAAEERLQKEAERIQFEKEKQLKIVDEERKRKEEEQELSEEKGKRSEEAERPKQLEVEQKSLEIPSRADSSELRHEPVQNDQHKPLNKQQKQCKVKHDEENRLSEQLKLLQQQASKQKDNEQNQKVSKDASLTARNGVAGSLGQKSKENVTATQESEIHLHEEKQPEEEINKQRPSGKLQEEQKSLDMEKWKSVQVHQNSDSQQKQVKLKEAGKTDEMSPKAEEENTKQKQKENGMNKLLLAQKNKDTSLENVSQNKQLLLSYKCNSPRQVSTKSTLAQGKHEMKPRASTNDTEQIVKRENSHASLQSEADRSEVACQTLKPDTVKCQVKESSNTWEKTVEAKRQKWMHECESWRYVCKLVIFCHF